MCVRSLELCEGVVGCHSRRSGVRGVAVVCVVMRVEISCRFLANARSLAARRVARQTAGSGASGYATSAIASCCSGQGQHTQNTSNGKKNQASALTEHAILCTSRDTTHQARHHSDLRAPTLRGHTMHRRRPLLCCSNICNTSGIR